ncbi:hypothetical protein [Halobacterium noricense]|nr:hypothetical protein [Halobacterium noricense]UHH27266.1 hypothetical protein LT974_17645 [Halobacterium noricense]
MTENQTRDSPVYRIHDEPVVETTDQEAAAAARDLGYRVEEVTADGE